MALNLPVPDWIGEDEAVLNAFVLLRKYREHPVSDATTTAVELTGPINNPPSGKSTRSIENYLWLLWDLFIEVACQVPNASPRARKLRGALGISAMD